MLYALSQEDKNYLLSKPETGMGYQVIEAFKSGSYSKNKYIVLNSQVAIEMDGNQDQNIRKILYEGIAQIKNFASIIHFSFASITLFNEKEYRSIMHEPKLITTHGATDNPKEFADGIEEFVRLSAFEDDLRIDKTKMCLLPGSYTTTLNDYKACKALPDSPNERYALPNNEEIKWAFYIQPKSNDTLQRGTVQPANGKGGGGKEVYFEFGTGKDTYLRTTPY